MVPRDIEEDEDEIAERKGQERWEAQNAKRREYYKDWTYVCECLHPGCGWRAEFVSVETWKRGAASRHRDQYNHEVKTTSTKILKPQAGAQPTVKDKYIAWCRDCKKHICVGARNRFRAGVLSHERATGHAVDVKLNPEYKAPKKWGLRG